ncbi:hypothetical protein TCE0_024f07343 [Talaromyces pinophilus]|jgi:catechol 2,3-dioxygenase-like lactoylglutathione lyase family enzyme|uniref:VOC domain-containing protein n=1 Tax=Talaromyces pinophilus TaxID=128442 RepID=A0A6V8HGK4_TALPI|nr:hypothetical protein TCE0_024f07343 [Talaromyces pinophilus]
MPPTKPTSFNGIHHLKLPGSDIRKTEAFYTQIFPFESCPELDHYTPDDKLFAVLLTYKPAGLMLEIRHNPEQAKIQKGWDPVTWGVNSRKDLEEWGAWFDEKGVSHSKVLKGMKGWVMAAEDPDGKIVRLYTTEEHEWTTDVDRDTYWLR